MSLTAQTAVTRRLTVEAGSGPRPAAPDGMFGLVLRALGRRPDRLPARTALYVSVPPPPEDPGADDGPAPHGEPAAESHGVAIRHATTAGRALRLAHRELHTRRTDLALVATVDDPAQDRPTVTVHVLRRAGEAVADDEPVLGVLDLPDGASPSSVLTLASDEAPVLRPLRHGRRATRPDGHRLLLWSGRDEADETRVRGELRPLLDGLPAEAYPALPTAVPCGQAFGPVRAAAVATAGRAPAAVGAAEPVTTRRPRPIALLFPGQGSQYPAMASGLYGHEPVFTAAVDAVLNLMGEEGPDIRADWLSGRPRIPIDHVRRAQPLLFAVDYAFGKLVLSWGVRPAALLGHSAGELVAATLAGVVSLPDAVAMMRERVTHAVKIPAGGMLAVAASERQLRPYLTGDVAIAAVNANQQTMLAGSSAPLAGVAAALRADGHTVLVVPATSPFHCSAMAPASDAVEVAYRGIRFDLPELPFYSGYTGDLMTAEEALSPRYWARQLTDTVYFAPGLEQLLAADDMVLVEAGPRQTLTAFARRHRAVRLGASAAVPLMPAKPGTPEDDRRSVLTAAARLWTEGHDLDLDALARLWNWSADSTTGTVRALLAAART